MSYRVLQVLLCMTLASSATLRAEESRSAAAISAAFSSENYDKGQELVRQVFARLQPDQSAQAATLIKSILASVPKDQAGQIVVAAIQGNPSLGTAILNASVSSATRDDQLAILTRLNFALTQHPEQNGALAQHVPGMLTNAARTVPVSVALTSPTFNPANSPSDTKEIVSPSDIKQDVKDFKNDLKDLTADQRMLQFQRELLNFERKAGFGQKVIRNTQEQIQDDKQDIKADQQNIRQDAKDIKQDLKGK